MSGRIRGEQIKDDSITGTDVDEDTLLIKHVYSAKYSYSASTQRVYIRWNAAGSNTNPGVNNRFVMPAPGKLKSVAVRSDGTPGSTQIGFHKASNGTEDVSTTATETQTIDLSTANTVATATFSDSASFITSDIICLSVSPTSNHDNVDMTIILEFDFSS